MHKECIHSFIQLVRSSNLGCKIDVNRGPYLSQHFFVFSIFSIHSFPKNIYNFEYFPKMTAQKIIFAFILILAICPFLIECFPNSEPSNRVKRFEWPWEYIGKTLCKTAANCDCGNGQSWAKCVSSPGYKASNCCGEGFVWSCCGREV